MEFWLVFSTSVPKSTIFWQPPQHDKDSHNILLHKKVQWFYFKGKCGNPDQPSVGAALTTATRGAGMTPSEHWGGTISIYWAGTNLHLPTQSTSKAKARAEKKEKKRKDKPTNKYNNALHSTLINFCCGSSVKAVPPRTIERQTHKSSFAQTR